jgi:preprotein translocase subunit SecG
MPFVLGLLTVVAVLASILLAFVVLLQEPKGGGIAAALGGSGMEAIGPATGGVNRFTTWVAAIWMTACFLHAIAMKPGAALETKAADKPADKAADTSTDKGAPLPGGTGGAPLPPDNPK